MGESIGKYLPVMVWMAAGPLWAATGMQPLDIKPGMWQITLTVRTSGQPPLTPGVLARLTPEERARLEQNSRQRTGEPRTTVKKKCLDQKELEQPLMLTFGGGSQGCRQTVVEASRKRQEIRVDCGSQSRQAGGTIQIEASDRENVKVSSQWLATDSARTIKMVSSATLKWLGAVCDLNFPVDSRVAADEAAPQSAPKAAPSIEAAPPPPAAAGAAYYYQTGKEQAARNDFWPALRSFNRAIEMEPGNATFYNARGYVYLRLQSYANAVVDFSDAIRLRPKYANAYQNRAIARRHLNDQKGAEEDNRKAAKLKTGQ